MKGTPKRSGVNRNSSARKFSHSTAKTKALNLRKTPMRGGYRI